MIIPFIRELMMGLERIYFVTHQTDKHISIPTLFLNTNVSCICDDGVTLWDNLFQHVCLLHRYPLLPTETVRLHNQCEHIHAEVCIQALAIVSHCDARVEVLSACAKAWWELWYGCCCYLISLIWLMSSSRESLLLVISCILFPQVYSLAE